MMPTTLARTFPRYFTPSTDVRHAENPSLIASALSSVDSNLKTRESLSRSATLYATPRWLTFHLTPRAAPPRDA